MYTFPFSIHPSISGHLGCFPILSTVNRAAVYIGRLISEVSISSLLDKYPEVGLVDHRIGLFLIFGDISILFSVVAAPFCVPVDGVQVHCTISLHPHQHLLSFFSPLLSKQQKTARVGLAIFIAREQSPNQADSRKGRFMVKTEIGTQ